MRLDAPEWLLLVPILLFAGWYWRRLRLWRPLRVLALVLLVLLLVQPEFARLKQGIDLWVLLDRSGSTGDLVDRGLDEWIKLLERSRRSRDDRIILVDYAAEVMRRRPPEALQYAASRNLTRTRLAVESALAESAPDKSSRILVFTDGFSTEPLGDLADRLTARGVSLDYRLVRDPGAADYRMRRLSIPNRVQVAEPFVLEIEAAGTADGEIPVVVFRNGQELASSTIQVAGGRGTLRFTDRIAVPGAFRYEARITPANDEHLGNNRIENWVEVSGGPRILLVTSYSDDPLALSLAEQGFAVEVVQDAGSLGIGQLSGCRAVILNNVPAWEIPLDFLNALPFFVRSQAGGLLMAGGKMSFGAGGYFDSPVDPLLPVSMELKNEHRKMAVAMAIVMDRSGSMSMTVPGGRTKMDLANEGAARAIELLGAQDAVSVHAVDSEAHEIVPMQQVQPNRDRMRNLVRRIESMGGGIFVYNGLEAAWNQLEKTDYSLRHIILFSDAADSEQPGAYEVLIDEITGANGSVSVIGLGTESDPDAALLKDIATRGGGRIFFSNQPEELPNIFAQETVAVARSAFISDPVGTNASGQWQMISARALDWPGAVDGYNLSYLRDGATAALLTTDEYTAPLVAFHNAGIGRAAAVSFPLGGEFSGSVRQWPVYGDFVQTLARWLMGDTLPPGIGLRQRVDGTLLTVDLLFDESWEARLAASPPELVVAMGTESDTTSRLVWERMAPGQFTARAELEEGELVRGAVRLGGAAIPFGPVVIGASAEWAFEPARVDELRATASVSGGRELIELGEAWRSPPRPRFTDLRPPLLIIFLLVLLADALVTRMGWRMPEFALPSRLNRREFRERARSLESNARLHREEQLRVAPGQEPTRTKLEKPPPEEAEPRARQAPPEADARRSRFARAKRKP